MNSIVNESTTQRQGGEGGPTNSASPSDVVAALRRHEWVRIMQEAADLIEQQAERIKELEACSNTHTTPQPAIPEWRPTNEELTAIYMKANGIEGKNPPITTERIFTAMRAMLAAAPKPENSHD